jgi:hypothetical protein
MDSSTACRVLIQVPSFWGGEGADWNATRDILWIRDTNIVCWIDFYSDLCEEVKVRANQKVSITYWDKNERVYKEIESDSTLMFAFGMYWDIRRLPLYCSIVEPVKQHEPSSANTEVDQSANNLPEQPDEQSHKESDKEPEPSSPNIEVDQSANNVPEQPDEQSHKEPEPSSANSEPENIWGEDNEVEYVGADDEQKMYKAMLSDDEQSDSEFIPDSDEEDHDDCVGADEKPEDDVLVTITDLDNPKIVVGVKFESGVIFKKAIRQYGILHEVQIESYYSESTRYRGSCKANKYPWKIHAS